MDKKFNLTTYEVEALKISLEQHMDILDEKMNNVDKIKHSATNRKKELKRKMQKRKNLLKDVLKKLKS